MLEANQTYTGKIHRAKWTAYSKADGSRGQALKFRVAVEGAGFADGTLHFSDKAAHKSYERIQEVCGRQFDREAFLAFMRDPASVIVGASCKITTEIDDDGVVVVKWLNADGLAGKPMLGSDEDAVLGRLFPTGDTGAPF